MSRHRHTWVCTKCYHWSSRHHMQPKLGKLAQGVALINLAAEPPGWRCQEDGCECIIHARSTQKAVAAACHLGGDCVRLRLPEPRGAENG